MEVVFDNHPHKIFGYDEKGNPFRYGELQHYIQQISYFLDISSRDLTGLLEVEKKAILVIRKPFNPPLKRGELELREGLNPPSVLVTGNNLPLKGEDFSTLLISNR